MKAVLDVIYIIFLVIAEFLKRSPIKTKTERVMEKYNARKRKRQANLRVGSESSLSNSANDDIDAVTKMREADNTAKLRDDKNP